MEGKDASLLLALDLFMRTQFVSCWKRFTRVLTFVCLAMGVIPIVSAAPANDNFANRITITGGSGATSASNSGASKETGEPNHAGNAGGRSLWWQWTAPTSVRVTINTFGSDFDTLLAVYTGTSVGGLTAVASNNDMGLSGPGLPPPVESRVIFDAVAGRVYQIAVDGNNGSTGRLELNWAPANNLPDLIIWPAAAQPYIVTRGYDPEGCEAQEGCVSADTRRVLNFTTETRNIGFGDLVLGSPIGNPLFQFDPCHSHYHFIGFMEYRLVTTSGTVVSLGRKIGFCLLDGRRWDPIISSDSKYNCANQGITAGFVDVYGATLPCQHIDITGIPAGNYIMEVEMDPDNIIPESNEANNTIRLPVVIPDGLPNDNFLFAQPISDVTGRTTGTSAGSSRETGEPNHAGSTGGSIWYRWLATANGSATFDTVGSSFDTALAVYTGSSLTALTLAGSNDDIGGGVRQSRVVFNTVAGRLYYIAVAGFGSTVGSVVLNWNVGGTVTPPPPPPPPPPTPTPTTGGGNSYWTFDDCTGRDSSTNGCTGVLQNGPACVPGKCGSALQFDGVNDYVEIPSACTTVGGQMSLAFWFKPSQLLDASSGRKDLAKKFLSYWMLLNFPSADGKLAFVFNSGAPVVKSTTATWLANTWYHIAATYDGAQMKIYVNGVLEGTTATTTAPVINSNPLQLGGNTDQGFYYPGALDEARLYNRALTLAEVSALHLNPCSTNVQARTLTVASINPTNNVPITVAPADSNGQTNGSTLFTRLYTNNAPVTLTAPAAAGTNNFQKWQRNGNDWTNGRIARVTMDADHRMTAVYTSAIPAITLTVASVNPTNAAVDVIPLDNASQGNGVTRFTRVYNQNVLVTLTVALTAGGNGFQKWELNGVHWSFDPTTFVVMESNCVMTAIYAPIAPAIIRQPQSQTNNTGGTVLLNVRAAGSPSLGFQWRRNGANLTDGSGIGGATTTNLTLSNLQAISAGNYDVVVTNGVGGMTSAVAVVTVLAPPGTNSGSTNLLGQWCFDDCTARDCSTGGKDGTLVNGPRCVPGVLGNALQFDGIGNYVNIPDSNSLDVSNRFTISLWFKPGRLLNATTGRKDLLQKFLSYWLIMNYPSADGKLAFVLNGGSPLVKSTTASWNSNQWYHAVATYDGATMKLYINGVLEGSTLATVPAANTTSPLQIGGDPQLNFWFPGCMDDARLYGSALTDAEVAALFNGSSTPPPPPLTNTPPIIAAIAGTNALENSAVTVPVTIGDAETPAGSLGLVATSSNVALVPNASITPGGGGSNRTLTLVPVANQSGNSTITVIVTDAGGLSATNSLMLTVTPVNDPPSISDITNRTTSKNQFIDVPFTVADVETPAGSLAVSGSAANTNLVPAANLAFSGTNGNRSVRVTPATDQFGITAVTITVSDGTNSASDSFNLTVQPPPPPVVSLISRWRLDEASGATALDTAGTNPGTLINNPGRTNGILGGALRFNGANNYVNVPDSNSLDVSNRFAISLWFKPSALLNAATGRKELFQKFAAYWLIMGYPSSDGKLAFVLNFGAPVVKSTTSSWNANQWYHAAAVCDGTNMNLYINGVLEGVTPTTVPVNINTSALQIGGDSLLNFWFPGCIDDARLYGGSLTPVEVRALYLEGVPPAP